MRINYKVLWVEDEKSWYQTTSDLFRDLIEDMGFKLDPQNFRNYEEVKNEIEQNGVNDYDLLLIDLNLKASKNGDEIIELIRGDENNTVLTDILFYSTDVEEVRNKMRELGLEGVYTVDRKNIETKFEMLVKMTTKKLQELNAVRGLIMAETSDLDEMMLTIVNKILESELKETFEKYIKLNLDKSLDLTTKKVTSDDILIADMIKDTSIFTSSHRAKCINKLYKEKGIGIDKFYQSYDTEILSNRNIFAHVKESIENGKRVLISESTGKKIVFDEQMCIDIRKSLIKYRNILEDIHKMDF